MDSGRSGRTVQQDARSPKSLIQAAADYGQHGASPPPELLQKLLAEYGEYPPAELRQALTIEQWGVQALYDKPIPAGEIRRMTAALNVYRAFASFERGKAGGEKWLKNHAREWAIVSEVEKMRH